MGKLLGLPMGMAPCYTLHSDITLEGQQIATAAAHRGGRELLHGRLPEHRPHAGLLRHQRPRRPDAARGPRPRRRRRSTSSGRSSAGIFARDEDGDRRAAARRGATRGQFCDSDAELRRLRAAPARGLRLRERRARGRPNARRAGDAGEPGGRPRGDPRRARRGAAGRRRASAASPPRPPTKRGRTSPTRRSGARLAPEARAGARRRSDADVQIVVSDGLSAEAVHHNVPDLLPVLLDGLAGRERRRRRRRSCCPYGRVKLAEPIAEALARQARRHAHRRAARRRRARLAQPVGLPRPTASRDDERPRGGGRVQRQPGRPLRVHGDLQHLRRRAAAGRGRQRDRREGARRSSSTEAAGNRLEDILGRGGKPVAAG